MQAETSVDTLVTLESPSQQKSENSSNSSETTDEISIQNGKFCIV